MAAVCKIWSLTADQRITGLCSMRMLSETERVMRDSCPICVSPGRSIGQCIGVDGCADFPVRNSFLLQLGATLTEPAHVADVLIDQTTVDFLGRPYIDLANIYDKYPIASDIEKNVTLQYQEPCSWVYQKMVYRFYRVTVITNTPTDLVESVEFTDVPEEEVVAPGFVQPYTCSTPVLDTALPFKIGPWQVGSQWCSSTTWGWKWTFRILQNSIGSPPIARLVLERLNARHCQQYIQFQSGPGAGTTKSTSIAYTPFRGSQTNTFTVPSSQIPKTGVTTGLRHQSVAPQDSLTLTQASYPPATYIIGVSTFQAQTIIAGWELESPTLCDMYSPLQLTKYIDASVDPWFLPTNDPLNSPFGLPTLVSIPFGWPLP